MLGTDTDYGVLPSEQNMDGGKPMKPEQNQPDHFAGGSNALPAGPGAVATRWIPCSERLPAKHGRYVVWHHGDDEESFAVWDGFWCYPHCGQDPMLHEPNVTHWMPLPPPPGTPHSAHASSAAQSDGQVSHVLVPREPTEEMIKAGGSTPKMRVINDYVSTAQVRGNFVEERLAGPLSDCAIAQCYKAMLLAAAKEAKEEGA